jgi:VanZ family protein
VRGRPSTPAPAPTGGTSSRLGWLLPALGYAALIFWLSHQPNPLPALTLRLSDKLLHAVEYAGLAGLLALGLGHGADRGPSRAALVAMLLAAAYGLTDELHQAFVPNRDASLLDWGSDAAGAVVGGILAVPFLRRWGSRASIRA